MRSQRFRVQTPYGVKAGGEEDQGGGGNGRGDRRGEWVERDVGFGTTTTACSGGDVGPASA